MKKLLILIIGLNLFSGDFFYEYGKKVELTQTPTHLRSLDIKESVKQYTTKDGRIIGIKNEIIVKLKEEADSTMFFTSYDLNNIEKISTNTYLVKLTKAQNIFTLSQKLYESSNTIYAIPNKIQKVQRR